MAGVTRADSVPSRAGFAARPPRAAKSARWVAPALLVVLALVVRIGALVADPDYEPRHDAFDYHRHGVAIAAGEGFPESLVAAAGGPSALRPPVYPYVLGAVYALVGDSVVVGRLTNAVFGTVVVLLLYLVAAGVWERRVALLAAGLAAVFPPLVLLDIELFSESLFLVLELAAVLAVFAFRRSGGALRWAAGAGALCGLAALTRNPGIVLVCPIAFGAWWVRPRLSARSIAGPATVVVCAAVVIAPWLLRNEVELGRLALTTSSGYALAGTYNDASRSDGEHPAAWRNPATVPEYEALFRTGAVDEGTLDATLRREATAFAWEHPGYVATAAGWNLLRLMYLEGGSVVEGGKVVNEIGIGSRSVLAERLSFWITAVLAIVGSLALAAASLGWRAFSVSRAVGRHLRTGPLFLWLVPVTMLVVTVPVAGLPRYRAPIDPFVLILAAIGILWILDRLAALRTRGATGLGAVAVLASASMIALGGCGDGGEEGGAATTDPVAEAPAPDAPSKAQYIKRADAICRDALRATRRLGRRFDAAGGLSAGPDPQTVFIDRVVLPGLRIRERQAERIRQLDRPPEQTEDLHVYLGLFDTLEELSRQRIRASRRGDTEEMGRLDQLLNAHAAEQMQAARRFGFEDCGADFLLTAFPTAPSG